MKNSIHYSLFLFISLTLIFNNTNSQDYTWERIESLTGGNKKDVAMSLDGQTYVIHGSTVWKAGSDLEYIEVNDNNNTFRPFLNIAAANTGDVLVGTSQWGIHWTFNAGNSWFHDNLHTNSNGFGELILSTGFADDGTWLCVELWNSFSLAYSTNHGNTWIENDIPWINAWTDRMYPTIFNDSHNTYLCTEIGLYNSPDLGDTWEVLLPGMDVLSFVKDSEGNMFAGVNPDGVLRSYDDGASWEFANNGLPEEILVNSIIFFQGDLFAGTENKGVFKSSDNGDSWVPFNEGLLSSEINHLELCAMENKIIAATGNGLYNIVLPNNEWDNANGNLYLSNLNDIAFGDDGYIYVASGDLKNVAVSKDNGVSWYETNMEISYSSYYPPEVTQVEIHPSGRVFGVVSGHGIYYSDDQGESWTPAPGNFEENDCADDLIIDDAGAIMTVMHPEQNWSTFTLFRSFDAGMTWEELPYPLEYVASHGDMEYGPEGTIYIAALDVTIYSYLLVSYDYGTTWDARICDLYTHFDEMAYSPADNYIYFLETSYNPGDIIVTTDEGYTYTDITANLNDDLSYEQIGITPNSKLFVKTEEDVYLSEDQGNTWSLINNGLPTFYDFVEYSVNFFENDDMGNIYLGTKRFGLYKTNVITFTPQNSKNPELISINPNPGNGIYLLNSKSTLSTDSKLFIFDTNGNVILTQSLGNINQAEIDISKELPGIYLLKIIQSNTSSFKKIIKL